MRATKIESCYIGPAISPEQFIAEHFFLYLTKGKIEGYDGYQKYTLNAGEYCMVRKNHLARYSKHKDQDKFEKTVIIFDKGFLKNFQEEYHVEADRHPSQGAFLLLNKNELVPNFVNSLTAYYSRSGHIDETFSTLKREELLLILLKSNPGLASIMFDFGIPGKADLEAFMNRNYKFNVGMSRFAYMTGHSLSAFKRDFKKVFNSTPQKWLTKKRLEHAYFQITNKNKKPSEVFVEAGFENFSHFSHAFKKHYGFNLSTSILNATDTGR